MNADFDHHIRVERLHVRRGGIPVLEDVSLALGSGLWLLSGANGSGKSTLLRTLAGIQPPAAGTIEIDGHDLWRDPVAARRRLGYLPETPELFPYLTPRELLRTANAVRGLPPRTGEDAFGDWVRPAALDLRIGSLSAGQRRKLALVAATAHEPPVLLLDEPANALDVEAVKRLTERLRRWRDAGHAIVVASHRAHALDVTADGELHVEQHRIRRV